MNNPPVTLPPRWSTASYASGDDTLPGNRADLRAHLGHCLQAHSRLRMVHQTGHHAGLFFMGHIVTSTVALLVLLGLLSMVL